jgi:hypothetical protein
MEPQFAALAFTGGGLVLSTQTPYEREVFVDYVRECASTHADVRLRVGRRTWRVEPVHRGEVQVCSHGHRPLHAARCYGVRTRVAECVTCALRSGPPQPRALPTKQRGGCQ